MSTSQIIWPGARSAVTNARDVLYRVLESSDPHLATESRMATNHCISKLWSAVTANNTIQDEPSLIKAGTKLDLYLVDLHLLNTRLESITDAAPAGSSPAWRATQHKEVISRQFDAIEFRLTKDWLSAYSAIRHKSTIQRSSELDPPIAGWHSVHDLWEPFQHLKGHFKRKCYCHVGSFPS
jgi:hypothetical protein